MPTSKRTKRLTEEAITKIARSATAAAYKRALRTGSIVVYRNGELCKIEAGGKSSVIKKLPRRSRIAIGSKFEIKPEPA
jgi:hypothetical protein